ncbi:MAG: hypothetical protein GY851_23955, partial [bacterium]|nr:hypothetical protein [bacterium]
THNLYQYTYDSSRPHAVSVAHVNGVPHNYQYDEAGNTVYSEDLSNPASPAQRYINYNCFNKPKEVYTIADNQTRKTSLVYDGDDRRLIKFVHSIDGVFPPAQYDAPESGTPEFELPEGDPPVSRAVEPGFNLESATFYLSKNFEKTTPDGVTWRDAKYIFAAGQRVAKIDSTGVHYFHKDHLGSTNVVTDEAGGNATEAAQYMPYGELWGHAL